MKKAALFICYAFLFSTSCVDPYKAPEIPSDPSVLVIDGFVNSSTGSVSTIKVSRSTPLSETKLRPELNAKVTLEGDDNSIAQFIDKEKGIYSQGKGTYESSLLINQKSKYRLRIKTSNGNEYLSDFVEVNQTPAIDSVTFQLDKSRNGFEIQVNTHDPENKTRNYVWEYIETWEYTAECKSNSPTQAFTCWKSENSTRILYFSTERLAKNVVHRFPITFIGANSPKQYFIYSILVKQYAVTDEALDYLQQLKNTTEQLGSLFDAQPSEPVGNFHSLSDADEPVIGYLRIHNLAEKRFFIKRVALPNWFMYKPKRGECYDPETYTFCVGNGLPDCLDCRLFGGDVVKPSFWIY